MIKRPKVAIVANGEIRDYLKIYEKLKHFDKIIAADGGARHCLILKFTPDLIVGDFDSIGKEVDQSFEDVRKLTFPKDKNETDLEIAILEAFRLNENEVTLFAATGKRVDHTLVNLHLLKRFSGKLFIENEEETIFALGSDFGFKTHEIEVMKGQTISLLPLGSQVIGVSTEGLRWNLNDQNLDETFLSISNICLSNKIKVSVNKGNLLCFLQSGESLG